MFVDSKVGDLLLIHILAQSVQSNVNPNLSKSFLDSYLLTKIWSGKKDS